MLALRPAAAHGCSEHHKAPTNDADLDDQPPLHSHPVPSAISTVQSTPPTHLSGGNFMKHVWQPSMRLIPPNQPPSSKHDGPAGAGLQHLQHRQLLLHLQSLSSVVISNVDEALNICRDHTFSTTTHTPPSTTPRSQSIAAGAHPELLFIINILNITSFPESTPSSIWRLPPWTAMMACPVACPMPHTTCHP